MVVYEPAPGLEAGWLGKGDALDCVSVICVYVLFKDEIAFDRHEQLHSHVNSVVFIVLCVQLYKNVILQFVLLLIEIFWKWSGEIFPFTH